MENNIIDKEYLNELNKLSTIKGDVKFGLINESYFVWELFCKKKKDEYLNEQTNTIIKKLISEENYMLRRTSINCGQLGVKIEVGDICYIDFGAEAYIKEVGFQHFGIILSIIKGKALVIPMTSNSKTYEKATTEFCDELFPIPFIYGLNRASVLFLNDAKFINSARIIDIKAHIDEDSDLFRKIKESYINII